MMTRKPLPGSSTRLISSKGLPSTSNRSARGDLSICAILHVNESAADEEPGRERTAVSFSVDGSGMPGFGW